ncbi:hypothetical protein ACFYVR_25000 [Rhodococcus sp. NPDC003318]|uniref:hypothetical protein n=1 Tax=Rhodococcus sp. NPDC003318 TaxID=3364503 RepID=UPI0036982AFD
MATKRNLVASRERARQTMAARREALLNREKENEADLAEFFKQDDVISSAKSERDAAIAKAEKRFTDATDAAQAASAQSLRRLKDRGESVDSLHELTGLDRTEIRRLLRVASPAADDAEKSTPVDDSDGGSPAVTAAPDVDEPVSAAS